MNRDRNMRLGAALISVLVVGAVAVFALRSPEQKDTDLVYTPEELQQLYAKYNITENDIKFAENKLPNYLEGTILYGKTKVIATETGLPPEGLREGVDYDLAISIAEMTAIQENARLRFIEKYGVDPANPKIDVINGQLVPKEEVRRRMGSLDYKPSE